MKQPLLHLLTILLLFISPSYGQEFSLSNNIRDLNLPTQEVYKVIQDKKGYLWFATEFGLYRHQQGSTTPIRSDSASKHAAIMSVCETNDGRIIFATINGKIFSVQQDTAIELPFSKNGFRLHSGELIYHLLYNDQQVFILTSLATYRISPDYSVAERLESTSPNALPLITYKEQLLPINTHFTKHSELFESRATSLEICFPDLNAQNIRIKKWPDALDQFRILTARWKDLHVVTYGHTLLLISNDRQVKKIDLPSHIIALRTDTKAGLWVGLYKKGYYYFDDPSLQKPVAGLRDVSISDICVDREGGIWMTSLERGVFFGHGTSLLQHTYDSQEPTPYKTLFVSEDGILAAAHGKATVLISDNGLIKPIRVHSANKPEVLFGYYETKQSRFFFNHMFLVEQSRSTAEERKVSTESEIFTATIRLDENRFLAFLPSNSFLYQNGKKISLRQPPERIYYLLKTSDGGLLAGSRASAYFTPDPLHLSLKKIPGDNGRVVQFIKTTKGNTFALIQHKGLSLFQDDSLKTILPSSTGQMYYTCTESKPGEIWIASNEGVWAYEETDLLSGSSLTGKSVTANIVYSFAKRKERMYLATATGVISMPIDINEKNETSFPLYLRSWSAGDKLLSMTDTSSSNVFHYNTGTLSWAFDIASFRSQPAALHYILKGPQADSGLINGQHLQLGNLRPGKYDLLVWATRNDRAQSGTFTQSFRISPPFWQTTLFIAAVLTAIISSLGVLSWLAIRRIRRRELQKRKMESDLLSIRLQALQAQMNPHFVFNAINSIQLFILEHKDQEAYHYLTQFSRLIRRVLTQSRSPLISLSDELETLRLYVGLEQLRFPDQFDFTTHTDPSIDAMHTYLPVMLLQPAIENAIVHGIADNAANGKVSLNILYQPDEEKICFSITDNGAGKRKSQSADAKPGHTSVSSVINEERIMTLNKIYDTDKFSLKVLSASPENSSGTTVTISIPHNLSAHA
jgi:hypothetical protein